MLVLVACERSGVVRDAFSAIGHDAWSCDLEPSDSPGQHYEGPVEDILDVGWDMMVCHPPCTYLCSSGFHWNSKNIQRDIQTLRAKAFAELLWTAPIDKIALENPVGLLSRWLGKPTQKIQPWQFGEDASKATCLWLKNLPPLQSTCIVSPTKGGKYYSNQDKNGANILSPGRERAAIRSQTYKGIAEAMALQWGFLP